MLRYLSMAVLMFALMLGLTACGGTEAEDANTNDTAATEEANTDADDSTDADNDVPEVADEGDEGTFVLSVTGAETLEWEEDLVVGCVEDLFSIQTFTMSPKLDVYMPANIQPGTYPLAQFDANSEISYVEGSVVVAITGDFNEGRGDFYFMNPSGEFIIEAMPTAAGERFAGSFTVELTDRDGDVINASASIDVMSNSFNFLDCQFEGAE
jgi:hypothetical protein